MPLALALPDREWVLLDGSITRCAFLSKAVEELGLAGQVSVVASRAEEAARHAALRSSFSVVVARSFAAPAVTAECGSPFLAPGGVLIVAEPPEASTDRWPQEGLAVFGLVRGPRASEPSSYQVLRQDHPCPDKYPRRVGVPAKRPLF